MKEYEEAEKLEGKVIDFTDSIGTYKGRIVGCDPDVGITIVNDENTDEYLICLLCPSAPNYQNYYPQGVNRKLFDIIVSQLKQGYYLYETIKAEIETIISNVGSGSNPTAEVCPFI